MKTWKFLTFQVREMLTLFKRVVVQYNTDYGYDGTTSHVYAWTLPNALLFTITIMTTIGKNLLKFRNNFEMI